VYALAHATSDKNMDNERIPPTTNLMVMVDKKE